MTITSNNFPTILVQCFNSFAEYTNVSLGVSTNLASIVTTMFEDCLDIEDNTIFETDNEIRLYILKRMLRNANRLIMSKSLPTNDFSYNETINRQSSMDGMGETVPVNTEFGSITNPTSKNKALSTANDARKVNSPEYVEKYFKLLKDNDFYNVLHYIIAPVFKFYGEIY